MSEENTVEELPALGTFLRDQREEKGVSLSEVTEVTKISTNVLEAIESDAYGILPAATFSRAFYSMYAEFLGLNPEEILARYLENSGQKPFSRKDNCKPPLKNSKKISSFAEPGSFSSAATMNIIIVAILIAVAAVCWSLSWNPATYISHRLHNLKTSLPSELELTTEPSPQDEPLAKNTQASAPALPAELQTIAPNIAPPPETTEHSVTPEPPTLPVIAYLLEGQFNMNGTLQITLDDGFVLEKSFIAGQILQWKANDKIVLVMPEEISGTLFLNGIEIPLPEANTGQRRLTLPEDLLD